MEKTQIGMMVNDSIEFRHRMVPMRQSRFLNIPEYTLASQDHVFNLNLVFIKH